MGLDFSSDRRKLLYIDGYQPPQLIDLATGAQRDALHFYNFSRLGQRLPTWAQQDHTTAAGLNPALWFDEDSRLTVDWRRHLIFWCQVRSLRACIPL